MKRFFNLAHGRLGMCLFAFLVFTLSACGGGGGGAGGDSVSTGTAGEASVAVSTIAGSSSVASKDATGTAASFNYIHGSTTVGGNLYVTDINNHNIRKIVIATGVVSTYAGTTGFAGSTDATGTAASFSGPAGIVNDGTNLYVAEWGNNKIRKIVISTGVVTTLAGSGTTGAVDATGVAASFNYPSGIAIVGANLYVVDQKNHKIRKIVIATGVVTTLAGSGTAGAVDNITGTLASFNKPYDIATDGSNLYVADTTNNKIRKIVISTGVVTTLAGSGTYGVADGPGVAATFASPAGIVIDGVNLYVAEWNNHNIRKIVISTGDITTFAGSGTSGAVDATGAAASFFLPQGIASDGSNLYVMDKGNHKVRQVVITSGEVTTLAGSELGFSVDATGTAATFLYPAGIVSDGSSLYVADRTNHKIRKYVIASGVVTTLAGSGAYGSADATGIAASFAYPAGVTVSGGNLYVADRTNHKIRKIVILTGEVTTLAGSGTAGAVNDTGTAASFNEPSELTTDGTNLYVSDTNNHKIRKIVISTGVVTTLAGSGTAGAVDDTGTVASFNSPAGLTIDGANLYVADSANHKIRKIVITSGVVTTIAGSGTAGSVNATGTSASFLGPVGITSDGTNLYVADQENHKIRKIVLASGVVSTWAGTGNAGVVDGTGATARFYYPRGIAAVGGSLYVTDYLGHTIRKIQ